MKVKGQAAMEYLMTYGWAIIIIIVAVAALYTMGVFNVKSKITCSPCFSNFAYVDYSNGTLKITNGQQAINITSVTGANMPSITQYDAGKGITFTGVVTTGDQPITITYNITASGLIHTDTATIRQ